MKIEETSYGMNLFLNNIYFKDVSWDIKSSVEDCVKNIFTCIRKNFNVRLKGFYKVKIYPNSVGTFLEIRKIDDDNYDGNEVEFRIIVIFNKDMYLKMDDCFYLSNDKIDLLFYRGYYYISLDAIDSFLEVADFGEVVLDDEVNFIDGIFISKKKKDYF